MTDLKTNLNTDNLQQLLNHAAPGPWTFVEEEEWEHVAGPEYPPMCILIGHGVKDSDGKYLFGNCNDTVLEEYPGNLQLAARAFTLAEEILRMRRELESMHDAWLNMAKDPNRIPAEQNLAEHVIDHIQTVLAASGRLVG